MKNVRFVVLDQVTFHLRKEQLECNELSFLPFDELRNVQFSVNAVLSLSQSILILLLHAPPSAEEVTEYHSKVFSSWLSFADLRKSILVIIKLSRLNLSGFFEHLRY